MATNRSRTPFDLRSNPMEEGLSDKSADHGLEVKDLAGDDDTDSADDGFLGPQTEADTEPNAATPAAEDDVEVEMIHHVNYGPGDEPLVPGQTLTLPARIAETYINTSRAKRV